MHDPVSAIPTGYHSVTPYIIVDDATAALDLYKRAFGAQEKFRLDMGNGKIGHAEFTIGDSTIMIADEFPDRGIRSPKSIGGTPSHLLIYLENVDDAFALALREGMVEVRPLADQFYGDRMGMVADPFGHQWSLATHIEDVPIDEVRRRMGDARAGS